ncbi:MULTISPECIES: hypothetical protein [unclassified Rhizobium]|uniref:hypothetical protein n=1 Tax=unclassified Rhizobium TaxID=2613769 RepID=UPI001ADA24FF|nr:MULTISPECIES: hypothetical protein [unclassified Rhizobium]MBO9127918.1 hypothetical protein [Rhizobium sp. 16-488-2b]MBO9178495.1 hypothetical protein [Rhizobium sp. 16-488-2a]
MKTMTEDQIPNFVQDVADIGCDIVAVMGGTGFLLGDADLSPEDYIATEPQILAIGEKYGRRDHLIFEIAQYLVSIGRYAPPRQSTARRVVN